MSICRQKVHLAIIRPESDEGNWRVVRSTTTCRDAWVERSSLLAGTRKRDHSHRTRRASIEFLVSSSRIGLPVHGMRVKSQAPANLTCGLGPG